MDDWNLEDRKIDDAKRGITAQKECQRGRKKQARPVLIKYRYKKPESWLFEGVRVLHRCLSVDHAHKMMEKTLRSRDATWWLPRIEWWIEERA